MKRSLLAAAFLFASLPAFAQGGMAPGPGTAHASGSSFIGPLDQETTITHFYGMQAGSAALAAANVTAVDLCGATGCAGANLCTGVKVLATGYLDVGVQLACNGGTQTVTTWCAGLASHCVSSGTGRVSKLYDQKGTAHITGASYAVAPDFILAATSSQWSGSKPVLGCVSSRSTYMSGTISALAAGQSWGNVYERNGGFASNVNYSSDNSVYFPGAVGANTYYMFVSPTTVNNATAVADGTGVTDFSHFHRVVSSIPAGSGTTTNYVDGAANGTGTTTGVTSGTTISLCGFASGGFADDFHLAMYVDPTAVNSTVGNAATNLTTVPLP